MLNGKAFSFHDEEYFSLIIKDAFATSNQMGDEPFT